jgi:N-acetylneuraminic acid mutarotase
MREEGSTFPYSSLLDSLLAASYTKINKDLSMKFLKQSLGSISLRLLLVFFGMLGIGAAICVPLVSSHSSHNNSPPMGGQQGSQAVLAASNIIPSSLQGNIVFNIPAIFNDNVTLNKGLKVEGNTTLNGDLAVKGRTLDVGNGNVIASNVLYGLTAGSGISIGSGQNPTITNNGVTSFQGSTGSITLSAGNGISISGTTITNSDAGSAQDIFKNITVGSSTIAAGSNADTLTFLAGTGITLSANTTNKQVTINSTGGLSGLTTYGVLYANGATSATTLAPGTSGYILSSNGTSAAPSWIPSTAYWQLNSGVLSPTNIANDLAVGGVATSSAKFLVSGTTGNIVASGTLTGLTGLTSSGTITFTGLSTGVLHASSGVLNASAVNLASSDITSVLGLTNGGLGANLSSLASTNQGGVLYSAGTSIGINAVGTTGQCLISQGSGAPIWTSCSAAAGVGASYWTLSSGALYPVNATTDLLIGGTSSASAAFGFLNVASGTPTASVSASTGATYLTATGTLATTNMLPFTLGGATTGSIQLSPKGTTGLFVNGSGNVGVGTTNPGGLLVAEPLNVFNNGGGCGSNTRVIIGTPGVNIGGDQCAPFAINQADPNGYYYMRVGGTTNAVEFGMGSGLTDGYLDTKSAIPFYFDTNNTHRLGLGSSGGLALGSTYYATDPGSGNMIIQGNLGIGTTSLNGSLDLGNSLSSSKFLLYDGGLSSGNADGITQLANEMRFFVDYGGGGGTNMTFGSLSNTGTFQEKMRFTGTGLLGIGTTSPVAQLDLEGAVKGKALAIFNETGNQAIFTASASGTPVFTIAHNGDVGIGTTSLGALLDFGNSVQTNKLYLYNGASNDKYGFGIASSTLQIYSSAAPATTNIAFGKYDGTTFTEYMRLQNGKLGIGTTTPAEALHIYATSGTVRQELQNTSSTGYSEYRMLADTPDFRFGVSGSAATGIGGAGTGVAYLETITGSDLQLGTNNTLRMDITSGGNVGIGTSSPVGQLDLEGAVKGKALAIFNETGDQAPFTASASGSPVFTIAHNGTLNLQNSNTIAGVTNYTEFNNGIAVGSATTYGITSSGVGNLFSGSNVTNNGASYFQVGSTGGGGSYVRLYADINAVGDFALTDGNANSYLYENVTGATLIPAGSMGIGKNIASPHATLDVEGGNTGGNAALIINQIGATTNDILDASASGTLKFAVANDGTLTAAKYTTQGGLLYLSNTAGTIAETGQGTGSQCLFGGTTPSWGSCAAGATLFNQLNGAISPLNGTVDFLVGGSATSSAKFGLINVFSGTPTATISGTTGSTYVTASGTLATTNMLPFTVGGTTTGPIQLSPKGTTGLYINGAGNVGIGTTNPLNVLDITGGIAIGSYAGVNTAPTNGMIMSGDVGIGTSSPISALDVEGAVAGKALSLFNETGDQAPFTASASGSPVFTIAHSGTVTINNLSTGVVQSTAGVLGISAVNLASEVTNTLPVANGGTGATTFTTNGILYGNGTNAIQVTAAGSSGQYLQVNNSGVPVWQALNVTGGAGGNCTNCLINNNTATQTIYPSGVATIGLSVAQTSTSNPTVDIFNVVSSTSANKFFSVDQNGNTNSFGSVFIHRTSSAATETWTTLPTSGEPGTRDLAASVWTGTQMFIFGGYSGSAYLNDGYLYNPSTNTWKTVSTTNAPSIRDEATAVWTGTKVIVWGGWNGSSTLNTGALYDPATDTWTTMTTTGAPSGVTFHTAVWTGSKMIVWGGCTATCTSDTNAGAVYDPATNTWTTISTVNGPSARDSQTAVWTGTQMIVWGGKNRGSGTYPTDDELYTPSTDTWATASATNQPAARFQHTAIWTGSKMIVWGGNSGGSGLNTGGIYDPVSNTWTATTTTGAPAARSYQTAVWTGSKMIVWGGYSGGSVYSDGSAYDPVLNAWTALSASGISGRIKHTAIWTGTQMVVFGGNNSGSTYYGDGAIYTYPGYGGDLSVEGDAYVFGDLLTNGTVQSGGFYSKSGADVAENYIASAPLAPGTVLSMANDGNPQAVAASTVRSDTDLLGVVTTRPGITLNSEAATDSAHPYKVAVALTGRVPVHVSTENGPIAVGDYLTSSSQPGVAMKATTPGQVIGQALQAYNGATTGTILVRINVFWYLPPSFQNAFQGSWQASISAALLPNIQNIPLVTADTATVSGTLNVLGRTTLTDVGITGTLSDGLISIHGLQGEIDTLAGDLMIQSQGLGGVNILNGLVMIDTRGNITTVGDLNAKAIQAETITATKGFRVEGATAGEAVLPEGQKLITIPSHALTSHSKIFITPDTPVSYGVKEASDSSSFTVRVQPAAPTDVHLTWWIVN